MEIEGKPILMDRVCNACINGSPYCIEGARTEVRGLYEACHQYINGTQFVIQELERINRCRTCYKDFVYNEDKGVRQG